MNTAFSEYSARILSVFRCPGTEFVYRVLAKNTGTKAWTPGDNIRVGTSQPSDRVSALADPSWLSQNRVATFDEDFVPAEGFANFYLKMAGAPEDDAERFQLVKEGMRWLPGTSFNLGSGFPTVESAEVAVPFRFIDLPAIVQIETTGRCNLKCRACPLTLQVVSSRAPRSDLAADLWARVRGFTAEVGLAMLHGFGEPLMNPRFASMIEDLDTVEVQTCFSTNGLLVAQSVKRLARLRHLRHVNVSIDSPAPETYRAMRGADVSDAMSGARLLAESLSNVKLTISSVVTPQNLGTLSRFPKLLAEMGIRIYELQYNWATDAADSGFDHSSLSALDEIREECIAYGVTLIAPPRLRAAIAGSAPLVEDDAPYQGPVSKKCTVPFEVMYIDHTGEVYPCCNIAGSDSLGHVRATPPGLIWKGTAMAAFRRDLTVPGQRRERCWKCRAAPRGAHPLERYSAKIVSLTKDPITPSYLRLRVRNTGKESWARSTPIRLGTARPRDRTSLLYSRLWMSANRLCKMEETVVNPGEIATFGFWLGKQSDSEEESFQLVVDGVTWLAGTEFALLPSPAKTYLGL